MASTPKQVDCTANGNNGPLGKRKKSKFSKGSYLSKWLDKTMSHIQDSAPSMDAYESYLAHMNWPNSSHFAPGFDPYRYPIYGAEPTSLPALPTYFNPMPYYAPECRYIPNLNQCLPVQKPRRRPGDNKEMPNAVSLTNQNNTYLQPKNITDNQDFASLPPVVASLGDTNSNSELNTNEKDENSNTRRFSDPCVGGLPDIAQPASGDMESSSETSSGHSGSEVGSRVLKCLLDQIATLKMVNERLSKDLLLTKAELETVRQQSAIYQGSSPTRGTTPNHTPLNSNGLINGQYSPGMLTDLVREIRDATRVREEAMYARMRAMINERNDSSLGSIDAKSLEKSLEDIKSSLRESEADKRHLMERVVKLETDVRALKVFGCIDSDTKLSNGSAEDSDSERMRLRRELADTKKAKQNAEEHALKLERLVTQLRSKFNGLQITNGPDSLPSEPEHEPNIRARRTSANSINSSANSTVVFGPVTDL